MQCLAAPVDAYGRRVQDKATILKLLCLACEVDCDGSALAVLWHPRDASRNNWYLQTDKDLDAIWVFDCVVVCDLQYSGVRAYRRKWE